MAELKVYTRAEETAHLKAETTAANWEQTKDGRTVA